VRDRTRDLLIAAGILAGTLVMLAARGFGTPEADSATLDLTGVLLATAASLPLAVRRAPLAGYLVVAAASAVLLGLSYPLDVPFGVVVGAYRLAAQSGAGPDRRLASGVAVGAFVPAVVVAYELGGMTVTGVAPELLGWAVFMGGIWLAGDRSRMRALRYAEMRERAERAEREAARERRLAAAEERTRIARELHDSAGHAINVILVQAGAARLLHEQDPDRSRQALTTIEAVARDTIGEIDRLVRALREDDAPPADPVALAELVEQHRGTGLVVDADVRGPGREVPRSVAWAAYRIVQEALTNAARHGCGPATLDVHFGADAAEITVVNAAAHPQPSDRTGHGIVGMRERANLLGGTLEAGPAGQTFRLRARLPYPGVAA
jgi:signal transduction histidine kinase